MTEDEKKYSPPGTKVPPEAECLNHESPREPDIPEASNEAEPRPYEGEDARDTGNAEAADPNSGTLNPDAAAEYAAAMRGGDKPAA